MRQLGSVTALMGATAAVLLPPPDLTVSQWAEQFRVLSREDSAAPGRWSTEDRPYQKAIMDAASEPRIQYVTVVGGAQWGKALALDTPIPTPTGWTTMGEVSPGDIVFDQNGQPVRVIGESEVFLDRPCFKVGFDDGSEIVADAEHLWFTESSTDGPGVRTTLEILRTLTVREFRRNHAIPVAGLSGLPAQELPIPPYTLGAWLGDGDSGRAGITFGEDGREVLSHIEREGVRVVVRSQPIPGRGGRADLAPKGTAKCLRGHDKDGRAWCKTCGLQRHHAKQNGRPMDPVKKVSFRQKLLELGVLNQKRIPSAYLRGSLNQRLALLQGLMDTDGYIRKGGAQCEFTTTNEILAKDVRELVQSLGFKSHIAEGRALLNAKDCGPKWRVTFQAYAETPVFRMQRKVERQRPMSQGRPSFSRRHFISAIEHVPSVPVKCIAVDSPDHLYLAGRSMIPTHNTQIMNNIIGHRICTNPGPIMAVAPTERAAEKWSKTRFMPMVRDCPELACLVGDKSRDSSNTILEKQFPGGLLVGVGANAPAGLASQPIRDLLLDEVDRIEASTTVGNEGDFEDLAEARTSDFRGRRLIYKCSTPTILGRSRIENSWKESDQRRWFIRCPHCDHQQLTDFRQVIWTDKPEPIYACKGGGCEILEQDFRRAVLAGEWIATRPHVADHAGFWVHGLMVRPMGVLVQGFLKAKAKGPGALQVFINTQLGEWWDPRDGDALQVEGLMARREAYPMGTLPDGPVLLVAAVDVQDDRLELQVLGVGPGEETWLIDYRQIPGNLATRDPWDRLEEALRTEVGGLRIRAAALDIGGHFTRQCYQFAKRPALKGIVFPIKGATKPQQKLTRRSSAKARLWLVDTVSAKDQIFGRLKVEQPGPGYMHFPQDLDGNYFEMLLAERPVRKAGRRAYEKVAADARNEALDLTVYCLAALEIYGPRDLEVLAAKRNPEPPRQQDPTPEEPEPATRRRATRVRSRGAMSGW